MDTLSLSNLLYRRSETVRYAEKSIDFLVKYARLSPAGFGIEVDGDALENLREKS